MREPKLIDYFLLTILALIWASAFFNIKIATYSYGPVTIAFLRIFFGAIPVLALCFFKGIKIEAFSKDWYWFASIGLINLVIPFFLIAYGVQKVQSNLAAILMAVVVFPTPPEPQQTITDRSLMRSVIMKPVLHTQQWQVWRLDLG